ncbi:MAG: cytochrome C biogenesis protein [Rhodospirillaceae bacterium TMED63]|nr:MAG: cytochrome C biogenesis protein [Rhodospirillaceae bacterium TMED63]RPG58736.1 MAG: cytochrome C biogenesis protein [Flavobacteriaceae bacterium TMED81]
MKQAMKLVRFLFSTRLTAILFIVFCVAMAVGTFVESIHNTATARIWVYNAWWFEAIMGVFVLNFIGNIKRYRLLRWEKWPVLLLHAAWILIILGAFVTRYFGFEGVMPIREGETTNTFLSEKTYVTVLIDGEMDGNLKRKKLQDDFLFTEATNNSFRWKSTFDSQDFSVEYVDFMSNAAEDLVEDPDGEFFVKIVEAGDGTRHDHYIGFGEIVNIHNVLFTLNNPTDGAINIEWDQTNDRYSINTPFGGTSMQMATQTLDEVPVDTELPLHFRSLYSLAGMQFVFPDPVIQGSYQIVKDEESFQDALTLKITTEGESETIQVLGAKGFTNDPKQISLGGLDFWVQYGSLQHELPFALKLNDFIAEKYPGTEKSYSSFMSRVSVADYPPFDHDIYMNHILNHKGYRFFQASFDPDEKGTVLSVNHDFWGTWITYVGYFILYIGLLGIMFFGKTRFKSLSKTLEKIRVKKASLTAIVLLFGFSVFSQTHQHESTAIQDLDSTLMRQAVPVEQAAKFGKLVIQDFGGRMKPANTFASELIRKVSKSDTYQSLNADQVLLSIQQNPLLWYQVPFIYLKRGNDSLRRLAGVDEKAKYASFVDFFDKDGTYKLAKPLEGAYKAATPNQFQKDFIETDRRINLIYSAIEGKVLRIFPVPDDKNNKWVSFAEAPDFPFEGVDSLYVANVMPLYIGALRQGAYDQADELLESISGFQRKYGNDIMPSQEKIDAEIMYNQYDIFKKLFAWYMYVGTLMFLVLIFQIIYDVSIFGFVVKLCIGLIILLFVAQTVGMGARWYISGHAPWSDAYESMLYVAWATVGMGLAFGSKSKLTIAATAFVASMVLMIAHWNWMDPEIANLVPVLDSYWLMIHVAVIVGSYGPFALGMIVGFIAMILMILTTKKTKNRIRLTIDELSVVNELALTVGVVMLTIGNFLGGQWANESWGRYWGWDPKETWALISILVYAFVLHMRLIPGLRSKWLFNLMSVIAFASIIMTYFGVNFYLVGLHSYASGDKVITPSFVYYSIAIVSVVGLVSFLRYNKYFGKKST